MFAIIFICFCIIQKRLPGNPLILLVPQGPTNSAWTHSKRAKNWTTQIGSMGKLITVTIHTIEGGGTSIAQCMDYMVHAVRTKITEVREVVWVRKVVEVR